MQHYADESWMSPVQNFSDCSRYRYALCIGVLENFAFFVKFQHSDIIIEFKFWSCHKPASCEVHFINISLAKRCRNNISYLILSFPLQRTSEEKEGFRPCHELKKICKWTAITGPAVEEGEIIFSIISIFPLEKNFKGIARIIRKPEVYISFSFLIPNSK